MKLHYSHSPWALWLAPVARLAFASAGRSAPLTPYLVKDINPGSGNGTLAVARATLLR
jgi:hypothetical protein